MRKYYIYVWENELGEVVYVGRGTGNRLYDTKKRTKTFSLYIEKHPCTPRIIIDELTLDEAKIEEVRQINKYKRENQAILNFYTTASCGGDTWSLMSEEAKENFRATISLDSKKKWMDKALRERMTNSIRKTCQSENFRNRQSEITKNRMADPVVRKKMLNTNARKIIIRIENPIRNRVLIFESVTQARKFSRSVLSTAKFNKSLYNNVKYQGIEIKYLNKCNDYL